MPAMNTNRNSKHVEYLSIKYWSQLVPSTSKLLLTKKVPTNFSLILVIDDENSTVVTAGAIVTVTVFLRRTNMKELFGDTTIKEKEIIK